MFHVKQSIKLILIIYILCLCGSYPAKADETYNIEGDYVFYTSNVRYESDMPPLRFYPKIVNYSNNVHQNISFSGGTTYQLEERVVCSSVNELYLGATILQGSANAGLDSYTQDYIYLNSDSDYYELHFNILQKRGGNGWVDIYAYTNGTWVKVSSENYTNSYSSGDILPSSKIQGWKIVCHYNLNSRFYMLRTDDMYAGGYELNEFGINIKDSQQQEEDTQKSIEENTRNTNTILGTVKNAIDNVKNAIDDVITGITNLPRLILDGLKELFIPSDFYGDLETAMNDIVDALGIVGYPISLYTNTCYVVRDTTTTSLTVDVPAFYYKGHTIFPRYHRDNIFYFQNNLVFENVQKTAWMRHFFGMFNADIDTITIGNLVKTLMSILMWFGILAFIIRIYNKAFGLDVNEEMGDDDE